MKKYGFAAGFLVLLAGMASAQPQLENPGFELWEDVVAGEGDTIREPVEWSSLKTSDSPELSTLSPVVIARSEDAHSGQYSVKLTNVLSFLVVNGVLTNGRLHPDLITTAAYIFTDTVDARWNTPFAARPDSIAGWYKYTPHGMDTMQVKVALHEGFGKQPDADYHTNWIGVAEYTSPMNTENEWIRFSAPFEYHNEATPEFVLTVLNSGSGTTPVDGSIAYFDDLEMIYNTSRAISEKASGPYGMIYATDRHHLVIKGFEPSEFQNIQLYGITGNLVWTGTIDTDRVHITPDHLSNGIYLVILTGRNHVFSQKIVLR